MWIQFDIAPRDALAAPTTSSETAIQSTAILVVSILSVIGAGWIILSFVCFKTLRSFRHQLILGLAFSDLIMAINFLSSSAMNISGRFIGDPEQKAFCSFNGFMTQVFVIQTDYWVLVIAVCTFFILADYKQLSCWVQDHRILLSCLPWGFSVLWAAIGLAVAGYGNIGAWCWFTSDEVRLLVNFVPRWLIIFTMLVMYARLYFVLWKAGKRFALFGQSSSDHAASSSTSAPGALNSGGQSGSQAKSQGAGNEPAQRQVQKSSKRMRKLARLMLMYPIAYMLVWTLPTGIRIYQATKGVPAPFALQTIDKACIVLQGFVDAIIYGLNESSLSSWRNLIWPEAFPTISGIDHNRGHASMYLDNKQQRMHSVRLSEGEAEADSSSSLDISVVSRSDSKARINAAPRVIFRDRDAGETFELGDLGPHDATPGIAIRKTVDITVTTSRVADSISKGDSFLCQ